MIPFQFWVQEPMSREPGSNAPRRAYKLEIKIDVETEDGHGLNPIIKETDEFYTMAKYEGEQKKQTLRFSKLGST